MASLSVIASSAAHPSLRGAKRRSNQSALCYGLLRYARNDRTARNDGWLRYLSLRVLPRIRHCEEQSDEAIQSALCYGLLRYARNDGWLRYLSLRVLPAHPSLRGAKRRSNLVGFVLWIASLRSQ